VNAAKNNFSNSKNIILNNLETLCGDAQGTPTA
jgi:hypothetical protein